MAYALLTESKNRFTKEDHAAETLLTESCVYVPIISNQKSHFNSLWKEIEIIKKKFVKRL